MVRTFRPAQMMCMVFVCLALLGCKEEREKKVLAQTDEAIKTVKAEKIAADLANTAQQLLANPTNPGLNSSELKTVKCESGGVIQKVIAYIPTSSTVVSNNEVPGALAERMKSDLTQRFAPENVVSAGHIDASCPTLTDIATNSPVLQLDATFGNQAVAAEDTSQVVSVTMDSCGVDANGVRIPGVRTVKLYKDGHTEDSGTANCGESAPSNLDELQLTDTNVPNWKERLTGTPNANTRILCVQGSKACTPISSSDEGTQIVCDNDSAKSELISNPKFDSTSGKFVPDSLSRSCGKGWTGQMIAQMNTKECTVKRSDGSQSVPALVVDIGYVGAKCEKSDVLLNDACPAGTPFEATGKMMVNKYLRMTDPVSLLPKKTAGANVSSLVYSYTDPTNGPQTNLSGSNPWVSVVSNLTNSASVTVKRAPTADDPSSTMSADFFGTDANLNTITDTYDFDGQFAQSLTNLGKISAPEITGCYAAGQTCTSGDPLRFVSVVVDRSGSMSAGGRSITPAYTACRATMANLFKPEKRQEACVAARAWQNIAESTYQIHDQAVAAWNANHEPVRQGSTLYDAIIKDADQYIDQGFRDNEAVMVDALETPKNVDILKSGLLRGQDCYPNSVQDNMYGSCAQPFASEDALTGANFTLATDANGNEPLLSCQSACPGVCITDAVSRVRDKNGNGQIDDDEDNKNVSGDFIDGFIPSQTRPYPSNVGDATQNYLPVSMPSAYRMQVVDTFTRTNLLTNLPLGVRLYYSEFINGQTDSTDSSSVGHQPVQLTVDDDNDPNNNQQNVQMSFWWHKIYNSMADKWTDRNQELGGGTPLYVSTDPAIDIMYNSLLKAEPEAPAVLIVLSDGANNAGGSKYYGGNFCEADVQLPSGYRCQKCVSTGKNSRDCSQKLNIDRADVRAKFGIEYSATRKEWCVSKGYDNYEEVSGYSNTYGQENSLVGIIGRNFPKTKVFYLGIDAGSALANACNDKKDYHGLDGSAHQVLYPFAYDDSASDQIAEAFAQATGGGLPDLEVGKKICKQKYGDGVYVNMGTPPIAVPPLLNQNNQTLPPNCKIEYLNVNAPPGTEVLPPNYIPDPIFPPVGSNNPYDYGDECVPYGSPVSYSNGTAVYNGYTNDGLMQPCQTTR